MRLIGLTGGIACGKSTCSTLLAQAGLPIIDCDLIARQVVQRGTWGYRRVLGAFRGVQAIVREDGELDRERLGELVFADPAARRRLNSATHLPVLLGILRQLLWHWLACQPVVVIDMPLLFETGFNRVCAQSVLVACDPAVQRARLLWRDKLSEAAADARIAAQMPLNRKRQLANVVLENDGSLEELQGAVRRLAASLQRGSWVHRVVLGPPGVLAALAGAAWCVLQR